MQVLRRAITLVLPVVLRWIEGSIARLAQPFAECHGGSRRGLGGGSARAPFVSFD
jgi:hypothetical protein